MPRLSEAERMRAIGMVDAGQNYSAVARFFNCSQPTIRNLIQRYQQTGSANDRPRPGAERVTTLRRIATLCCLICETGFEPHPELHEKYRGDIIQGLAVIPFSAG